VTAADAARAEAGIWVEAVRLLGGRDRDDPAPSEAAVAGFDPSADLSRRATRWGHRLAGPDLGELCRFAAGLAIAEAEGWEADDPTVATRAYEDRRFLAGDRMVAWAVPWADAVGAPEVGDLLLDLGDRLRLAPALVGHEGMVLPGEDSHGPVAPDRPWPDWLRSVLSGVVLTGPLRADPGRGPELERVYRAASRRWADLAGAHPGTGLLWSDLSARAARTADAVARSEPGS
jgi:hypothetical protein